MVNEAIQLKKDIEELDRQIAELKSLIEKREIEFNREVSERESDPMWQVAATDYIQKGDRSGLENWKTNKLMAEQTLVDRINSFDTESINLNKEYRTINDQINATRKSIQFTQDESEKISLRARLKELENSKKQVEGLMEMNSKKKENAIKLYEKRYGRKLDIPSNYVKNGDSSEVEGEEPKVDKEKMNLINELKDEASDFALDNVGSKSYTKEQYDEKKKELLEKCKKAGIKGKEREEIIAKLGEVPSHTNLDDYKITSGWAGKISSLKNTPTLTRKAIDDELLALVNGYSDPYGKAKLQEELEALYPQSQQGKIEQGVSDQKAQEVTDWNKNKSNWRNAVNIVATNNDRSESAQKKHQEAYNQLNEYAKKQLAKEGYVWDGRWWTKKNNKNGGKPSKRKGF